MQSSVNNRSSANSNNNAGRKQEVWATRSDKHKENQSWHTDETFRKVMFQDETKRTGIVIFSEAQNKTPFIADENNFTVSLQTKPWVDQQLKKGCVEAACFSGYRPVDARGTKLNTICWDTWTNGNFGSVTTKDDFKLFRELLQGALVRILRCNLILKLLPVKHCVRRDGGDLKQELRQKAFDKVTSCMGTTDEKSGPKDFLLHLRGYFLCLILI